MKFKRNPTLCTSCCICNCLLSQDVDGFTALHLAAASGHSNMVRSDKILLAENRLSNICGQGKSSTPQRCEFACNSRLLFLCILYFRIICMILYCDYCFLSVKFWHRRTKRDSTRFGCKGGTLGSARVVFRSRCSKSARIEHHENFSSECHRRRSKLGLQG